MYHCMTAMIQLYKSSLCYYTENMTCGSKNGARRPRMFLACPQQPPHCKVVHGLSSPIYTLYYEFWRSSQSQPPNRKVFSKVEKTLTSLRSTMGEERLEALVLLEVHRDRTPSTASLIDAFALGGARKLNFIL